MNVVAFSRGPEAAPAEQMQEIRAAGFAHYRRVSDDPIGKMALVRATVLILADLAVADPDPEAALSGYLADIGEETRVLIAAEQGV